MLSLVAFRRSPASLGRTVLAFAGTPFSGRRAPTVVFGKGSQCYCKLALVKYPVNRLWV